MNPKFLDEQYKKKKNIFHHYLDNVKKQSKWDIYTLVNPTLIKNPYASSFPIDFFLKNVHKNNKVVLYVKNILLFYIKSFYLYISYIVQFFIFKLFYKKKRSKDIIIVFDIFALVDTINKDGKFNENYLSGVYNIFDKYNNSYALLLRIYGISKNPLKLKTMLNILNDDSREFIFEYEFLSLKDFLELFCIILVYPFKTLKLLQKKKTIEDEIFNYSLIYDIKYFSFDGFTRYLLGKNIAKISSIKKIYSWNEFQVIERSFNYGIRKNNQQIELIGMQFYLNYETYFNAYVDDLDYDMLSSPHEVFVNGKYYVLDRKKVKYDVGVSLRYKNIFEFQGIKEEKNVLLLGSYIENDTKYMLDSVKGLENVVFKNHPAVNIKHFGNISDNIKISHENIYELFKTSRIVISTASGTAVEAIACGLSVIIIASQQNLTANPLITYGKGKIWDIAFSKDDVCIVYNNLIEYRKKHKNEINQISVWYKENFFQEPTEERIKNIFRIEETVE